MTSPDKSAHASPLRSAAATEAQHSAGFVVNIPPHRRAAARFVGAVRRDLQRALADHGGSVDEIARAIGASPAEVDEQLDGRRDMSLGRVAEIAWALGRRFNLSSEAQSPQSEAKPSAGSLARDEPPSSPPPNPVGDEVGAGWVLVPPSASAVQMRAAREAIPEVGTRQHLNASTLNRIYRALVLSTPPVGGGGNGSACTDLLGAGPDGPGASDSSCQSDLLAALKDMREGWRYIRQHHGDLYGVGWDRAEQAADAAIAKVEAQS